MSEVNAVEFYGLVLTLDVVNFMVTKVINQPILFEDIADAASDFNLCDIRYSFIGQAFCVTDSGLDASVYSLSYNEEPIYYIPLENYGGLFNSPYNSFDEIIQELKESIGIYLPDNYNYRGNIRHVVGVEFNF